MQIAPGSLLISHPVYTSAHHSKHVVYITESNSYNTTGLILNSTTNHNLSQLMLKHGIDWHNFDTLYQGGDYFPNALVMLHTNEWYSSNTMQTDKTFAISSDDLMIDKLAAGNTPEWYRLFVGCTSWDSDDLEHQLRNPKPEWLLLHRPSQVLIELSESNLWNVCIEEYSQDVFSNYI